MIHASRALQSYDLSGEGINSGSRTYFFDHTRTWRTSPDEGSLNTWVTSETTRTWKTIHSTHTPIHSNKVNMRGWQLGQMILGNLVGLKLPSICFTGEEKPRKITHLGNLSRPGIEPGPSAWQARMLPPAPERWTLSLIIIIIRGILIRSIFYWAACLTRSCHRVPLRSW